MALNDGFSIGMSVVDLVDFTHKHPEAAKDLIEKAAQQAFMLMEGAATARGWSLLKHDVKSLFNWEGYNQKLEAAEFVNEFNAKLFAEHAPKNQQGMEQPRQQPSPQLKVPIASELAYNPGLSQQATAKQRKPDLVVGGAESLSEDLKFADKARQAARELRIGYGDISTVHAQFEDVIRSADNVSRVGSSPAERETAKKRLEGELDTLRTTITQMKKDGLQPRTPNVGEAARDAMLAKVGGGYGLRDLKKAPAKGMAL